MEIPNNVINFFANELKTLNDTNWEIYYSNEIHNNPRYDSTHLNRFERQIFSREAEDGIIAEIFKRIGTTNKFFVEFGIGPIENNTLALLINQWSGLWLEADANTVIESQYAALIASKQLAVQLQSITAENIEQIFQTNNVPLDVDFLSIDVDGNDYWIWKALNQYKPRVLCIEYNAILGSDIPWTIKYQPEFRYKNDSYFGASLKALEKMGQLKGYKLVCCDFKGVNAFFVREDLIGDKFVGPFTSENFYQPPRYKHMQKVGHTRVFNSNFEIV